MASGNSSACIGAIKPFEGGYVDHPSDQGGETKYGIYNAVLPAENIKTLTWARAKQLCQRDFWCPIRGDSLPAGVNLVVLDPATVAATAAATVTSSSKQRLAMLRGLKTGAAFGRGWTSRVTAIEPKGLAMAGADLRKEAVTADRKANAHKDAALGSGASGSVIAALDAMTIGRQHIAPDGVLTFRHSKTGGRAYIPWTAPMPDWAASWTDERDQMLAAIARLTGRLTFLQTRQGTARSVKGLGNIISTAARAAGIDGRSAHGLRKSRLTMIAEAGGWARAIMAWGDHKTLAEAQRSRAAAECGGWSRGRNRNRTL